MAISVSIICTECGKPKTVWAGSGKEPPKICAGCTETIEKKKRARSLSALKKLSVEERLEKIEAWIYDYKPPRNLRDTRF